MADHAYRQKRAMLAQFWKEMAANFGKRWIDEGDVESERFALWLEGVSHFTTAEIRDGILHSRRSTSPHPPSLNEFRGLITVNRKTREPDNGGEALKQLEERQSAKLLAGSGGNKTHRIIQRDGQYVHQVMHGDEWVDSPFMKENPDGMTAAHARLARKL